MAVKPTSPRHACAELGNEFVISIPSPKYWAIILFKGFALTTWAVLEYFFIGYLISSLTEPDQPPVLFFIPLVIFLTAFGAFLIHDFAWQISGREIVEVTNKSITIRRVALGVGPSREYSAAYIKELHASPTNINFNRLTQRNYDYSYPWHKNDIGTLAFDYAAGTFRFGSGVDEAEAKQILAEIQQKYPQYKN
jgi:hypothetical protein